MTTAKAISLYLRSCHAKGLSKRTIQWYGGILKSFASLYPELPDNPESLETFINRCHAGDERRHGYFRTLRAFYNYSEKRLNIQNPIRMVDAPKRKRKLPRPIAIDGLVQLLSFPHPGRLKAALIFLTDTGVRVGELVGVRPEDFIETQWGYVSIVNGKTGPRIVPVSRESYSAIIKYLPFGITANHMSRLLAGAFRDAHVPGTAHSLRHSFGTLWHGDDISILQKIMGHTHISTTMQYRQVQYEQMALAHNIYSPLKMVLSRGGNIDII
jgi:integrase